MSILQLLDRMHNDAELIQRKLLEAPADLTGDQEPKLFNKIQEISRKIREAKNIWG